MSTESGRAWWRPRTLSQKLVLYIVTAMCALLIATIWVGYDTGRRSLEQQTNAEAIKQLEASVASGNWAQSAHASGMATPWRET